jgi:hypothetical protein
MTGMTNGFGENTWSKEINKDFSATIEKIRLVLGMLMMLGGLYFGLFTVGAGEGLGFLTVMASPFVMVTDK